MLAEWLCGPFTGFQVGENRIIDSQRFLQIHNCPFEKAHTFVVAANIDNRYNPKKAQKNADVNISPEMRDKTRPYYRECEHKRLKFFVAIGTKLRVNLR